mgnify:CR=1 FL=1
MPDNKNSIDLVNVQVDGHWIKVKKGTRMIEACKQAEAEVPHYCYHPKLPVSGNCRMCLVHVAMPVSYTHLTLPTSDLV